jgi:hypothetical protein
LNRLRDALLDIDRVRALSLQPAMERFDWRRMAPCYDDMLERVLTLRTANPALSAL